MIQRAFSLTQLDGFLFVNDRSWVFVSWLGHWGSPAWHCDHSCGGGPLKGWLVYDSHGSSQNRGLRLFGFVKIRLLSHTLTFPPLEKEQERTVPPVLLAPGNLSYPSGELCSCSWHLCKVLLKFMRGACMSWQISSCCVSLLCHFRISTQCFR